MPIQHSKIIRYKIFGQHYDESLAPDRIYRSHPSDQLLDTIGQAIPVPGGFANGCSEAEVLQLFEQL